MLFNLKSSMSVETSASSPMSATEPPPLPEILIPYLPNDVSLNILARVPRQYHGVLSAVSKSIRSVLSSPQLFTTRSLLNRSEDLLYFKLGSLSLGTQNWFAVYRKPNPISTGRKSLLRFARIPPNPVQLMGSAYTAVGPKIYVMGGTTTQDVDLVSPSSDVWILDCHSHTWERGPSMRTPRFNASVSVVNHRIYVIGGRMKGGSWVEVFDSVAGRWEPIPGPLDGRKEWFLEVDVVDGRICVRLGTEEFWFDPETKTWEVFGNDLPYVPKERCVVDGVLYRCENRTIKGFDVRNGLWKELHGVKEGLPKYLCGFKVVNLEGRLVMLWGAVRFGNSNGMEKEKEKGTVGLWCAEIEVRKNGDDGDWWGEVHWSEKVALFPEETWGLTEECFYKSVFLYDCVYLSASL